jgi:hypothetical protein
MKTQIGCVASGWMPIKQRQKQTLPTLNGRNERQKEMVALMDVSLQGKRVQQEATESWLGDSEGRTETGWKPMGN